MKRNAFGQLILSPHIQSFNDDQGAGGGGGDGKTFTPPASQEELDKLINGAVARTHKQYEPIKEKATKWDAHEAAGSQNANDENGKPSAKTEDTPAGLSDAEVQKLIAAARAEDRLELALDRVNDALDKALEGRTFPASLLISLDRKQFVADDGKSVNATVLADWVKEHTTEIEAPDPKRRRLPGQGERDANATGGSVSAGRDLFNDQNKKSSRKD